MTQLDLGRPQSRNLSLDERQQLLAATVIADLQQERTVFFQLAKLPPNAEFLKHLPLLGQNACDDAEPATLAWPLTIQGCFIQRDEAIPHRTRFSAHKIDVG
jgi:hypothetical protein